MEIFESLVGQFLTCDDKVFVAPQYLVAKNSDICPDFVAIDDSGPTREVVVVEVTTGADLTELKKRILDRELRWFAPLRARFDTDVRMIAFIRQDLIDAATKWAAKQDIPRAEVCFFALEDATFSWKYWVTRRANGLPR